MSTYFEKMPGVSVSDLFGSSTSVPTFEAANVIQKACEILGQFEHEPDYVAKALLLICLNRKLLEYQQSAAAGKCAPLNLSPLYERLILLTQKTNKSNVKKLLMRFGLKLGRHERKVSSQNFFDVAVDYLSAKCHLTDIFDTAKSPYDVLIEAGPLAVKHPKLITPQYFEMCCSYVSVPFQTAPSTDGVYASPHEIRRKNRIAHENRLIDNIHSHARRFLQGVLKEFKEGSLDFSAHELFDDKSIQQLASVATHKVLGHNSIVIESMLEEIKRLKNIQYPGLPTPPSVPPLRLGYQAPPKEGLT